MRRSTTRGRPPWCFVRSSPWRGRSWAWRRSVRSSRLCPGPSWTGPGGRPLVEERQLEVGLRMFKPRQAHPDQPHRMLLDMRLLKRRAGGAEDRLDVVGRARPAHLATHQPEVLALALHLDRPRTRAVAAQAVHLAAGP